jgi:hypothetical protein
LFSAFIFSLTADKEKPKKTVDKEKPIGENLSSSDIHKQVVQMIRDLGYSKDEAKIIKAGLYNYTKTEYPELNSRERALQMKKITTAHHISNIDI